MLPSTMTAMVSQSPSLRTMPSAPRAQLIGAMFAPAQIHICCSPVESLSASGMGSIAWTSTLSPARASVAMIAPWPPGRCPVASRCRNGRDTAPATETLSRQTARRTLGNQQEGSEGTGSLVVLGKVWPGAYVDSIRLMQVADALRRFPGVSAVELLIATEANRRALAGSGLWPSDCHAAGITDLVLAVRAAGEAPAHAALEAAERLLAERPRPDEAPVDEPCRSIRSAIRREPGARFTVVSVPGPYAANEAHQALAAGHHVFIFSDGVTLEEEVRLKRRAAGAGLLVMGPECGTAILDGVGIGFANRVRRGPIGLVGASGTGLQEVTCLLHRLGSGVSQAIGTGGRDLDAMVGGLTTLEALRRLALDPDTRVLALVSKPASPRVAERVLAAAGATGKPVVACLLGWQGAAPAGVRSVETLEATALACVEALGTPAPKLERPAIPWRPRRRAGGVRGFYTGGSLCEEARGLVGPGPHRFVDFGDAEYTRGRPHPMIDPALRSAAVAAAGDDPEAAVILVDVVLGECAHPDPAGAVAEAVREARQRAARAGRTLDLVAHVVGTDGDAQGLAVQERALAALDVVVCASNRISAEVARELAEGAGGR